jgi:hypothetical protein
MQRGLFARAIPATPSSALRWTTRMAGGPLLPPDRVARRSRCKGIAHSSRLVSHQNRLRHGVQMWSVLGLTPVIGVNADVTMGQIAGPHRRTA